MYIEVKERLQKKKQQTKKEKQKMKKIISIEELETEYEELNPSEKRENKILRNCLKKLQNDLEFEFLDFIYGDIDEVKKDLTIYNAGVII